MCRFLFSFLLLALISLGIKAQSISGSVEDAGNSRPLSNVTVSFTKSDSPTKPLLTVSDSKGHFIFTNVPSGSYTLTITSIG